VSVGASDRRGTSLPVGPEARRATRWFAVQRCQRQVPPGGASLEQPLRSGGTRSRGDAKPARDQAEAARLNITVAELKARRRAEHERAAARSQRLSMATGL